jgi:hypothetical protein
MNYFAHATPLLDWPLMMAGIAVPDWLSVLNRRVRARSKTARRWLRHRDQRIVQIAAGIVRHHSDDDWFHRTRAFTELSWQFTVAIRDRLPKDDGLRPSFLGHILVELLLDAELIRRYPQRLDRYYLAMDTLDVDLVAWVVNSIATGPALRLAELIPRFSAERFLYDYAEDAKLLLRLNNVMARVRLPEIPASLCEWFPEARQLVRARYRELLPDWQWTIEGGVASSSSESRA